jgi:hypothetical protein
MKSKCPNMQNMQEYAINAKYARKPQNMQKMHILCKCIFCPSLAITIRHSSLLYSEQINYRIPMGMLPSAA